MASIDWEVVERFAKSGCPAKEIAACFGLTYHTFRKHARKHYGIENESFQDFMRRRFHAAGKAELRDRIFTMALTSDRPQWAIFAAKNLIGFSDHVRVEDATKKPLVVHTYSVDCEVDPSVEAATDGPRILLPHNQRESVITIKTGEEAQKMLDRKADERIKKNLKNEPRRQQNKRNRARAKAEQTKRRNKQQTDPLLQ